MKKILSIDGGGIRGIIPAMILANIEEEVGRPVSKIFDLIAGTSTGGILALGLSLQRDDDITEPQFSADRLSQIYANHGREIFERSFWDGVSEVSRRVHPALGRLVDATDNLFEEGYSREGLERVLQCHFRDNRLAHTVERGTQEEPDQVKVMVTSYDIQARETVFLKSWRDEYRDVTMVNAALATSAAPTYFEPLRLTVGDRPRTLIDGGIFVNTPVISAYAEAVEAFGNREDFFVLSLGTGSLTREIQYAEARNWGKLQWTLPLLYCMFDGISAAAHYQMERIVGNENYRHLTVKLDSANDDMDDASQRNINALRCLAQNLINDESVMQPIYDQLNA
jgi:patatin-like phospholipase/acyl hydrolase